MNKSLHLGLIYYSQFSHRDYADDHSFDDDKGKAATHKAFSFRILEEQSVVSCLIFLNTHYPKLIIQSKTPRNKTSLSLPDQIASVVLTRSRPAFRMRMQHKPCIYKGYQAGFNGY